MSYDWVTYNCAWCKKKFIPNHVKHKFCSSQCRLAESKQFLERYRERSHIEQGQLLLARLETQLLCDAIDEYYHEHPTL